MPRRLSHGEEATLVEHLGELRARLLISIGAVVTTFIVAFIFHGRLIDWLTGPLPPDKEIITIGVTEPFFTAVKVSLYAALAVALPILLYQLWSFLAPAMQENSQRVISSFVMIATGLFAVGVAFGYFIVLPRALDFLTNFDDEFYEVQIRASYYYGFVVLVLFGLGVVFELPIFILALVRLQVVTSQQLLRNWRISIFLIIIVAVLLPTVDPVSLFFEAVPLVVLYFLSAWLAKLFEKRWERSGALWARTADSE